MVFANFLYHHIKKKKKKGDKLEKMKMNSLVHEELDQSIKIGVKLLVEKRQGQINSLAQ